MQDEDADSRASRSGNAASCNQLLASRIWSAAICASRDPAGRAGTQGQMADTPAGRSTAARSRAHRAPEKVHPARPPHRKPKQRNPVIDLGPDRLCRGCDDAEGYGETESKTKKTPPVRLGKRILSLLREWRALDGDHAKYVVHWNGQKIKQIHRAFARAAKEAGVRASPHTLRHTRATWVMQDGDVPPWEAAGHLGMSLKTLQKYAKHSPDFQKRAAEV